MPALVAADADTVGIFLNCRSHDLINRAVMSQVDNLCAGCLQDSPDYIDGYVMTVKEACGSNKTYFVFWFIQFSGILHCISPLRLN